MVNSGVPHVDVLPLLDDLLDHHPGERRVDGEPDVRLARLFQRGDLRVLHPHQLQALPGRGHQPLPSLGDGLDGGVLELLPALQASRYSCWAATRSGE